MALDTTKPEDGVQVADLPRYIRETRAAITTTGVTGVTFESGVSTGDAVYLDSTNNVWRRSLADDPTRGKFHGFADVDQGLVVIWGFFTNEAWVFTDGATIYVADDDLGALTATDTGLVAGICVAGDTILLDSQISASFDELRAEVIAARDGSADLHTKLEAMDAARAAVASEVATARGASATLAGRLSLIDSSVSGVTDEVETSRGDAATLGQRLDVSINPDGSLKTTTSVSNFAEETAAILYVSSSTFTVAGDKTAVYVTNRTIRCNSSSALIGYVSSSSYVAGTGLTTVIVTGVTVPVSLTSIEYSFHPNEMPRLAHSGLSSILAADPSSSDVTANKHVSNNQLKVLTDGKQPLDSTLTALAGLTTAEDQIVLATGVDSFSMAAFGDVAQGLGAASNAGAARDVLGLGDSATKDVGTGSGTVAAGDHTHSGVYQPADAELTALAGLTSAADKGIQFTGTGTAGTYDLTAAGKALLDDANAAAQRTTLGLGSAAVLTAGTAANNIVQLNASGQIPAVDGSLLTNLPAGGLKGMQVFTSSGTFTVPAGVTVARVICVGGGGGSGGAANTSPYVGGAGGGGGYSEKIVTGLTPSGTITVTVGAGGTAGTTTGNGGSGGTSSFGSHVTAPGGSGGTATTGVSGAGGSPTTSGALNIAGQDGLMLSDPYAMTSYWLRIGGASFLSRQALSLPEYGPVSTALSAVAGSGIGAGALGPKKGTTNLTGAAGAAGIVIVQW